MSQDAERIRSLYASTLKPRLEALEGFRRELKASIIKSALLVGGPFLLFVITLGLYPDSFAISAAAFALIFVGVVMAGVRYLMPGFAAFTNYRIRFKQQVIAEVFRVVMPSAVYEPMQGIASGVFDEPGIFNTRGQFVSDDRVRGRIGQAGFEAAEVRRAYRTGSGRNARTIVVFHGLFVHLDFDRALRGTTILQPARASSSQIGNRDGLQLVPFESPEVKREFSVYSSDKAEARDILTPAILERILALGRHTRYPIFLAFKGQRVYLGVHYGRKLFEPGIASTTSLEAIEEIAEHFGLAETIVRELNLNALSGPLDLDDSWPRPDATAAADGLDALQEAVASGKVVTADQVWQAALEETSSDKAADAASTPRPSESSIEVQHTTGESTIDYGLSFGFLFAIAVTIVALVLTVASLRAFGRTTDLGPLVPLMETVPPLPQADALVAEYPFWWLIGSSIVGSLFTLWWLVRVRRVVIRPEVVLIWRGLRPFPRRYRRPPYGRAVRIDKAVYVGKVGSSFPINPSASPILRSEEEAKWIASEMGRAFRVM